jgi:hypothetical protein
MKREAPSSETLRMPFVTAYNPKKTVKEGGPCIATRPLHRKDWAGYQVPTLIKVDWIDRLNVEDVLRVLTSTNVKVRIVLKGETDQIGDRVLRGLAQVFTLLDARPLWPQAGRRRLQGLSN